MPKNRTLKVVAGHRASFHCLVGTIIFLLEMEIISSRCNPNACCVVGNVCRIRILIAVYRLMGKLE